MAQPLDVAAADGMPGGDGEPVPIWQPRMNGLPAGVQRALRATVGGPLGVPIEWMAAKGNGLPEYWLRTAAGWTWRWRLSRMQQHMRLRLEAHVVCSIPTRRWAFGLRQMVRMRYQGDRGAWTDATSTAWTAAASDRPYRRPKGTGWPGEGAAIPPAEGNGGAPLSWLLRCDDTVWEVQAASRYRAWLRLEGTLRLVDYEEGMWLSDALGKREARDEERARNRATTATLPPDWPLLYREGGNQRVEGGDLPETAHRDEAWTWGRGWCRQPGDNSHYGTRNCPWCSRDAFCALCDYADRKGVPPEALISTGSAWIDEEAAQPWGGCEWEIRQLVRYGLLDSVEDPEARLRGGGDREGGGAGVGGGGAGAGSTTGAVVEHPGSTSEVGMTEAGCAEAGDVIKEEDDYVILGSGSADGKQMDGEWDVVARPTTNEGCAA